MRREGTLVLRPRRTSPRRRSFRSNPLVHRSRKADYEAFCTAPGEPHQIRELPGEPPSTVPPRFVPEMQLATTAGCADRWRTLVDWFRTNCGEKRFEGLEIERFIEQKHRLPDEIIQAVKDTQMARDVHSPVTGRSGLAQGGVLYPECRSGQFRRRLHRPPDHGQHQHRHDADPARTRGGAAARTGGAGAARCRTKRKLGEIGLRLERMIRTFSKPQPGMDQKGIRSDS